MDAQSETYGHNRKLEALGAYSQSILLELRGMAQQVNAPYLVYVLELGMIEASDLAAGKRPSSMASLNIEGTARPDPEEIARRILETAA